MMFKKIIEKIKQLFAPKTKQFSEEELKEMGVELIEVDRVEVDRIKIDKIKTES